MLMLMLRRGLLSLSSWWWVEDEKERTSVEVIFERQHRRWERNDVGVSVYEPWSAFILDQGRYWRLHQWSENERMILSLARN